MSGRITNDMLTSSTLNDVNAALAALQRSSEELSSGRRILQPSDDPYGASHAIDLQSQLDGLGTYASSVQDGTSWAQASEGAMANIGEAVQRARELVVQASNGTYNAGDLHNIALDIAQLTEAVKLAANTQYAGQYVFSGTATTTAPYAQGEEDTFKGNTEQIARAIGPGTSIAVNSDLSSLLGNGAAAEDGKLLDTLRTIARHLNEATPESREALAGDLKNLDTNLGSLTALEATTGARTDQLRTASTRIETLQSSLKQTLSNTEDADFAKVSMAYSNEQAAYQAALRAGATIVQESLLNFLH
jgi:flagellar hook-associated protein 3 FlgL